MIRRRLINNYKNNGMTNAESLIRNKILSEDNISKHKLYGRYLSLRTLYLQRLLDISSLERKIVMLEKTIKILGGKSRYRSIKDIEGKGGYNWGNRK